MTKAVMDIEDLLVWAYRDQRIDRVTAAQSARAWEPMAFAQGFGALHMLATLGILVSTTGFGDAGFGMGAGDDVERIHGAVLALGDSYIQIVEGDARIWHGADAVREGFSVRACAGGHEVVAFDGVAVPVCQAVTTSLLVCHAKNATQPDCYLDWAPGKPMRLDARGRRVVDHEAAEISADEVVVARAEYHIWRSALVGLAATLADGLDGFAVTGPRAMDSPWLTRSAPFRVHEGGEIDPVALDKLLRRNSFRRL